jgi:uncharacterized protein YndB with AHSA1/START domain
MTIHVDATSDTDPVIVISRVYDAPRELVWKVLTDPAHVAQYWGGPGFTNPVCEMDLRPGGAWRHVMRTPDGHEFTFNSVFVEVEPPERLVWRPAEASAGGPPAVLQTVVLEDLGDGRTKWTVIGRLDSFAERDVTVNMGYAQMVSASSNRLAEYLKTL